MKVSYWQRGESLDYKNATTKVIEENTVITIGTRIGVSGTVINPGAIGSILVEGVFEMKKAQGEEIEMGTDVFFDGENITSVEGENVPAGYAAQGAEAGDEKVIVKLLG